MPLWLHAGIVVILLLAVVPAFVWANTGRLSSAWYALKRYLLCLGVIAAPAAVWLLWGLIVSP